MMDFDYSLNFLITKIDLKNGKVEGILTDPREPLKGIEREMTFCPEFIGELKQKLNIMPFRNTLPENIVHYLTGLNPDSLNTKYSHCLTIYYKRLSSIENNINSYHREKIGLKKDDAKEFERKTMIEK